MRFCIILIFIYFLINYFFHCINISYKWNVKNWINVAWILIFKKQWFFSLFFFVIFIYNLSSYIYFIKKLYFQKKIEWIKLISITYNTIYVWIYIKFVYHNREKLYSTFTRRLFRASKFYIQNRWNRINCLLYLLKYKFWPISIGAIALLQLYKSRNI